MRQERLPAPQTDVLGHGPVDFHYVAMEQCGSLRDGKEISPRVQIGQLEAAVRIRVGNGSAAAPGRFELDGERRDSLAATGVVHATTERCLRGERGKHHQEADKERCANA